MPRCIYCSQDRPREHFTTEHVVNRAFGGFDGNLTMSPGDRPYVCRECNQFFGETIDLVIGRDSYEAFQRLMAGDREADRWAGLLASRARVTLPSDSRVGPLRLEPAPPVEGRPGLRLLPQVRFESTSEGWMSVLEEDLPTRNPNTDPALRPGPVAIFCATPEEEERLRAKLEDLGLDPETWREVEDLPGAGVHEMDLDVQGAVDRTIARAIAKISFNYLAWYQGAEFVLRRDFDDIRTFIRHGEGEWTWFVEVSETPILMDDTTSVRHTRGHLITVGWAGGAEGHVDGHLVGQVSLYNSMTYRVHLCHRFSGLWRDVASGHHYDLESRAVRPLGRTRLARPPGLVPILWG